MAARTKDSLEDFFASTFFLYHNWPATASETCGCAVPRETWLGSSSQSTVRTCPLCSTEKIRSVLDGYAHSRLKQENTEESRPRLAFKHGSLTYSVGLPEEAPSSPERYSLSLFGWPIFREGENATQYHAQNHLAYVLGLQQREMKILCKGKVLYPSSSSSEKDVSDLLLEESSRSQKTPHLLVMGTPHEQQLRQPPNSSSSNTPLGRLWIWFESWLWWSYQMLEPFLPKMMRLKAADKQN